MARIYEENELLRTELPEATSSYDGSGSKVGRRYIEFSWCALPVNVTSCLESGFLAGSNVRIWSRFLVGHEYETSRVIAS